MGKIKRFLNRFSRKKKPFRGSISVDNLDESSDEESRGMTEQEISRIMDDMWERYPMAVVESKRQFDNYGHVVFEVN